MTTPLYPDWMLVFLHLCLDGSKAMPIAQAKFDSLLTALACITLSRTTWAAVHALVYAKAKRDQHVVVFSLRIRDLSEDPPVLWPYSITIKPSNAAHCPRNRPNVDLKGIGYFRVCLAGEFSGISAEYPIHISRTLTNPLYPDWILILLNLCLDGSKSRPIMEAKFESLLTTLDYMKLPCTVPTHLGPALPIGTEVVVTNDEHWMEDLIERDVWGHLGEENMRALIEYNLRKYGATREAPVKTRRDKYLIV
ncbi:hypothetical protein PIIN_08009 [Serendipita indica DSM 11827]|uniref:Uncharacterized protein n=1 Tax=Serendipita indica (strain DSM 11827) TaxID=1109443 RepID=G4TRW2_SERID|nr:hypothetical protein PIIN_08009 [Serendipita indica DSM 11827]